MKNLISKVQKKRSKIQYKTRGSRLLQKWKRELQRKQVQILSKQCITAAL